MAKATAICECKVCGKKFVVEHECCNRQEANRWEQWAVNQYDICPDCLAEQRKEEEAARREARGAKGILSLTGTVKQIAWAEEIRDKFENDIEREIEQREKRIKKLQDIGENIDKATETLEKIRVTNDYILANYTDSKWWIELRMFAMVAMSLINDVYKEHRAEINAIIRGESVDTKEIESIKEQYRETYVKYLGKKPSEYNNVLEMFNQTQPYWDEIEKMKAEHPELEADFVKIQKEENIAYEVRNSTLKGSAKQIAWAAEIQYKIRQILGWAISQISPNPTLQEIEARDIIRERNSRIYNAKYAGDIIDLFGHIHFSGDAAQDFSRICAVYKTSVPQTEGQKEILGK